MPLETPVHAVPWALFTTATQLPAEHPPPVWQVFATAQVAEVMAVQAPAALHRKFECFVVPLQ
jgi:hypothetical protein